MYYYTIFEDNITTTTMIPNGYPIKTSDLTNILYNILAPSSNIIIEVQQYDRVYITITLTQPELNTTSHL